MGRIGNVKGASRNDWEAQGILGSTGKHQETNGGAWGVLGSTGNFREQVGDSMSGPKCVGNNESAASDSWGSSSESRMPLCQGPEADSDNKIWHRAMHF